MTAGGSRTVVMNIRNREQFWFHHPDVPPDISDPRLFYSSEFECEKAAFVRERRLVWEHLLRHTISVLGACSVAIVLQDHGPVLVDSTGRPLQPDALPAHFAWRCETSRTIRDVLTGPLVAPPGSPCCPQCGGPAAADDVDSECLRCIVEYWRGVVLAPPARTPRQPRRWRPTGCHHDKLDGPDARAEQWAGTTPPLQEDDDPHVVAAAGGSSPPLHRATYHHRH